MISLMYCCPPGTWVHPIFSTAFALTMATLTVRETDAIGLRLLYLAMAVVLVLVVNRFLLPNRREPQFRRNLQELFRLQSTYWAVIRRSLRQPVDPGLFSELLSQFHMVYHEAVQYADRLPAEQAAYTGSVWWYSGTCSPSWSKRKVSSSPVPSARRKFRRWTLWRHSWKPGSPLPGSWIPSVRTRFPGMSYTMFSTVIWRMPKP